MAIGEDAESRRRRRDCGGARAWVSKKVLDRKDVAVSSGRVGRRKSMIVDGLDRFEFLLDKMLR